jgi:putative ABC transport system permease protein
MSWEFGPIARSFVRRKSTFFLVMLEVASGFTTITALVLAGTWYQQLVDPSTSIDHRDLVIVAQQSPILIPDAEAGFAAAQARATADLAAMRAVPGVVAVATVSVSAVDERLDYPVELSAPSSNRSDAGNNRTAGWTVDASPEIAEVLRLRVREGALPGPDAAGAVPDALVLTRCLRERLFGTEDQAIGRLVHANDTPSTRVAAVVEDVSLGDPWNMLRSCIAIRFGRAVDERDMRTLLRAAPGQRESVLAGLRATLGESTAQRRVSIERFDPRNARRAKMARGLVITLAVFGGIVTVIALLGTFTVSSFLVRERRRTIGIRRALGGTPREIVRYFLLENSIVVLAGIGVGLLSSWALFSGMRGLFPGLTLGWRPLVFTGLLLWLDATIATWLPARRATRITTALVADNQAA